MAELETRYYTIYTFSSVALFAMLLLAPLPTRLGLAIIYVHFLVKLLLSIYFERLKLFGLGRGSVLRGKLVILYSTIMLGFLLAAAPLLGSVIVAAIPFGLPIGCFVFYAEKRLYP